MTNDSPIHSATLQSMAVAIARSKYKCPWDNLSIPTQAAYKARAKAALRAFLQSAEGRAVVEDVREALKCHKENCQEIGTYEYSDEDGAEWLCKKHKSGHFFAHGSGIDEVRERINKAITLLRGLEKECL